MYAITVLVALRNVSKIKSNIYTVLNFLLQCTKHVSNNQANFKTDICNFVRLIYIVLYKTKVFSNSIIYRI